MQLFGLQAAVTGPAPPKVKSVSVKTEGLNNCTHCHCHLEKSCVQPTVTSTANASKSARRGKDSDKVSMLAIYIYCALLWVPCKIFYWKARILLMNFREKKISLKLAKCYKLRSRYCLFPGTPAPYSITWATTSRFSLHTAVNLRIREFPSLLSCCWA